MTAGDLPVVAVAYDRTVPILDIAPTAKQLCRLLWVVDGAEEDIDREIRLLRRFGDVVDIGGCGPAQAAERVRPYQPIGVVTFTDARLAVAADLAAACGLRFHSPQVAARLVDKGRQRDALHRAGLAVPRWWSVSPASPESDLASVAEQVRWPAVIKPRSGEASRSVYLAADRQEFRHVMGSLGAVREELLVEEYIPDGESGSSHFAPFVSVESIACSGTVSHLAVTGRFTFAPPFRETGMFLPACISEEERGASVGVAGAAIAALGIRDGCVHTELKLTPDGPVVVEVNGRVGGGVAGMLMRATGFDLLALVFRLALGEHFSCAEVLPCDHIGYFFNLQPPQQVAILNRIEGLETVSAAAGVDHAVARKSPGDVVDWRVGTRSTVAEVSGAVDSHGDLERLDDFIHSQLVGSYRPISKGTEPAS